MSDDLNSNWSHRLDKLLHRAAEEFRGCPNDPLQQLQACARYFNAGSEEGFDHGELIDYLGISTPSVLSMAGYSDSDALRVMDLLPLLVNKADSTCKAPTHLPPKQPDVKPLVQTEIPFANKSRKKEHDA